MATEPIQAGAEQSPVGAQVPLRVEALPSGKNAEWNRFVHEQAGATFFHRVEWRQVLEHAFGHRGHYLQCFRGDVLVGVLPLVEVKSLLFGHSLVSTPFCVYGGALGADPQAQDALVDAAAALAEQLGVDYLELRNLERQRPDWPCKDSMYVTFRRAIVDDDDANLKAIPRKQRAMVRKAQQTGLTYEIDAELGRFYTAYSTSVRNLGTPVFSRKYFSTLQQLFGDDCEILTVTHEGQLVASVLSFYFRDQVLPYYGGGTDLARTLKGNDFMYWSLMCHAQRRGARRFDYGRSKVDTGPYSFKKNWGFAPEPLYYEYHLVKAKTVPEVNPLNPKYRLMVETWKRLPLGVSQWLGPWVSRALG